jgi:hypothetical protein
MPKYYVQSGAFRGIVVREDAQLAALWVVESVMREPNVIEVSTSCDANGALTLQPKVLHPQVENSQSQVQRGESAQLAEGLFRLADAIGVSQRGFDRKDRKKIRTSQAVLLWMLGGDRSGYVAG